jgi:hypothetical protein
MVIRFMVYKFMYYELEMTTYRINKDVLSY